MCGSKFFTFHSSLFPLFALFLLAGCQESMEDRCEREAKEYTEKKCPAQIIRDVRIDSVTFTRATHTMNYYYTLTGVMDDKEALEKHDLRGEMLKGLRNSTTTKAYKDAGYSFRYVYYSTANPGEPIFDETYKEKDYR